MFCNNYKGVVVAPVVVPPGTDPAALPVVLLVPGSGGFDLKNKKKHGRAQVGQIDLPVHCPFPCWYAWMQINPSGYRANVPEAFMQFVNFLRAKTHKKQNAIIGWGFSRGGKWLIEIVRNHAQLLDAAVIFGGYPLTKCEHDQQAEVQELIAVRSCMIALVHFAADSSCGVLRYPVWHAELERHRALMLAHGRDSCLLTMTLAGNHSNECFNMWHRWEFQNDPLFEEWFTTMWRVVSKQPMLHFVKQQLV